MGQEDELRALCLEVFTCFSYRCLQSNAAR